MRNSVLVLAALLLAAPAAGARMYEWRNPGTSSVQFSGVPPGWYRSGEGGPRVRVYEGGRLIDDTAVTLPAAHRERLREAAFGELQRRQQREAAQRLELAARREAQRRARAERAEARKDAARKESQAEQAAVAADAGAGTEQAAPALDALEVERLKSIIADWDLQQRSTR